MSNFYMFSTVILAASAILVVFLALVMSHKNKKNYNDLIVHYEAITRTLGILQSNLSNTSQIIFRLDKKYGLKSTDENKENSVILRYIKNSFYDFENKLNYIEEELDYIKDETYHIKNEIECINSPLDFDDVKNATADTIEYYRNILKENMKEVIKETMKEVIEEETKKINPTSEKNQL